MLKFALFVYLLTNGIIKPQDEHEGRQTYIIYTEKGKAIENAYKGEVMYWIETGTFKYDDFLED